MIRTGRAFALARAKEQGPEITRRLKEFSSKLPKLELRLRTPSELSQDIALSAIALAAREDGMNVAIEAIEHGVTNEMAAGELRLIVTMMGDLWEGEPQLVFRERKGYRVI